MKIELSISSGYVSHWSIYDAIREIYQNAIDEQTLSNEQMISTYDKDSGTLTIGNYDTKLDINTLVLGNSPKFDDDKQIGQFGEGYKLALIVLLRNKINVVIENNDEIWTPSLEYSDIFKSKILTINIEKGESVGVGAVKFIIDLEQKKYNSYTQYNLALQGDYKSISTSQGEILLSERNKAKIFVEGLFICKMEDSFKYGYNFKAGHIPVDRDRQKLSSFDVQWKTSNMIGGLSENDDLVMDLIDNKSADVQYIESHLSNTEIADKMYGIFELEYGINSIPVGSEYDRGQLEKTYDGVIGKVMGGFRFDILKHSNRYIDKHSSLEPRYAETPHDVLIKFMESYDELFSSALRKVFIEEVLMTSKDWK